MFVSIWFGSEYEYATITIDGIKSKDCCLCNVRCKLFQQFFPLQKAFDQTSISIIRLWMKTCWKFSLIFAWRRCGRKRTGTPLCNIHFESFIKQHEIFIVSSLPLFYHRGRADNEAGRYNFPLVRDFFVTSREENFLSSRLFLWYEHIR